MNRVAIVMGHVALVLSLAVPVSAEGAGAVINDAGIAVKLITTRDCKLYREPSQSSAGSPCHVFTYWYVLPPDPRTKSRHVQDLKSIQKNGFYRVSATDNEKEFKGWIQQEDAVEWHHRQAVTFASRQYRGLASFFPTEPLAIASLTSGDLRGATHREPESTRGQLVLMPLLESGPITVDDHEMSLFRVALLSGDSEATGGRTGVTTQELLAGTTLDIVFVIDTTQSMKPAIDQVRRSIARVTNELARSGRTGLEFRFGLVGYRDISTVGGGQAPGYLTKVLCDLEQGADHGFFLDRLTRMQEAQISTLGYPEDVLAGVDLAMQASQLKWNEYGWKQIVVVGDSSMKEPYHPDPRYRRNQRERSIDQVKTVAQSGTGQADLLGGGYVVSAVLVADPRHRADNGVAQRQFEQLTRGRFYSGHLIVARGGATPEDFSATLTDKILRGIEGFDEFVESGGRASSGDRPASQFPAPLVDLIATTDNGGSAQPGFADRWSTEYDSDGNRLFVPQVFVKRRQLKSFNTLAGTIKIQLDDVSNVAAGERDVSELLHFLKSVTMTLNIEESIDMDTSTAVLLAKVSGLPIQNPIFSFTIEDLKNMSQTDFDDWRRNVGICTETVQALLDNPNIWYKLYSTADDRELHAFVPLADLP